MLLDNLALDLSWEVRLLGDSLSFGIVRLLHQVVNFHVVLHRIQLDELSDDVRLVVVELRDVVDTFLAHRLLNLNVNDRTVSRRVPKHRNLVLEVIDGQL